jgi:hypothetical protein
MGKRLGNVVLEHFLNSMKLAKEQGVAGSGWNSRGAVAVVNWKLLGEGHFGQAFACDLFPGLVVKTSNVPWDGWRAYAEWVVTSKVNSKHLPKIYAYKELPWSHTEQFGPAIAVMEKLVPFEDRTARSNPSVDYDRIRQGADWYRSQIEEFGYGSIRTLCRKIADGIREFSHDLHGNNIMIRPSDGEVVVTDPLAFHHDYHEDKESWRNVLGMAGKLVPGELFYDEDISEYRVAA